MRALAAAIGRGSQPVRGIIFPPCAKPFLLLLQLKRLTVSSITTCTGAFVRSAEPREQICKGVQVTQRVRKTSTAWEESEFGKCGVPPLGPLHEASPHAQLSASPLYPLAPFGQRPRHPGYRAAPIWVSGGAGVEHGAAGWEHADHVLRALRARYVLEAVIVLGSIKAACASGITPGLGSRWRLAEDFLYLRRLSNSHLTCGLALPMVSSPLSIGVTMRQAVDGVSARALVDETTALHTSSAVRSDAAATDSLVASAGGSRTSLHAGLFSSPDCAAPQRTTNGLVSPAWQVTQRTGGHSSK